MLLLMVGLTVGCSDEPVQKKATATAQKARPKPKSAVAEAVSEPEQEEETPRFAYSPIGRRDPFRALVTKGENTKEEKKVPLTPLQRFDLGQFRLQAVLIGKGEPRAMVSAPDGKTYILSPGIKIGKRDGVVADITKDAVLVEEVHYDLTGAASTKMSTIDMPEQKMF